MIAGLGLVTFDYFANANWEIAFLILGTWSVFTSTFGYCPFYRILGWNTCPTAIPAE
jgi:hypothetical protein